MRVISKYFKLRNEAKSVLAHKYNSSTFEKKLRKFNIRLYICRKINMRLKYNLVQNT